MFSNLKSHSGGLAPGPREPDRRAGAERAEGRHRRDQETEPAVLPDCRTLATATSGSEHVRSAASAQKSPLSGDGSAPSASALRAGRGRVLGGTRCSAHLGQGPQLRPRILPGVEFEREGVSAPVARAGGRGLGVVRGAPRLAEVAGVRVRRVPAPLPCTACCPARSPHPVPDPVTPTPPGPTDGGAAGGPGNVPRGGSRPPLPTGFFRPSSSLQTFPHRARIYVEAFSTADGLGQLHSPKEQGNRKGPRTSKCPPHSAAVGAAMSKRSSAKRIRLQRTTKKFS